MEAASFEGLSAAARTQIASPELFLEQFISMYDTYASFDFRLRGEAASSLTHRFEKTNLRGLAGA